MSDPNPYRPTLVDSSAINAEPANADSTAKNFIVLWTLVFAANLIIPLIFAASLTEESGRIGMVIAVILLLFAGWYVGWRLPKFQRRLLVGGAIVAVSQLFPIHHFIAGMIAYELTRAAGGAGGPTDNGPIGGITTEYGGFLCTFLTGTALVTLSLATGWLVVALGVKIGLASNKSQS